MIRISHNIKQIPSRNIHHAVNYAEKIGLPLNHHISINLWELGLPSEEATVVFRKIINQRFSPWLRRSTEGGYPPTYVWAAEAPNGNIGVHLLIHIPTDLLKTTIKMFKQWLSEAGNCHLSGTAFFIRPVSNRVRAKNYILKGTEETYAKLVGINHVPQGCINGRRSGFSKNLGPTARKRSGYKPKNGLNWAALRHSQAAPDYFT